MERSDLSVIHKDSGPVTGCLHCGNSVSEGQDFCCKGCEAAYHIEAVPARDQDFSPFVEQDEAGQQTMRFSVFGMHCAACLTSIEASVRNHQGVTAARVNMSTCRLVVKWHGTQAQVNDIAKSVMDLGYRLRPADTASGIDDNRTMKELLRALAVSGFAAGNLMLISVGLWTTDATTMGEATRALFHWVSALIAMPTVLYAGQPFFRSAITVLREGHTNMDVPISLGISLACAMSLLETITGGEHVYFDSAVMLVFFLLIGRVLDERARSRARASASHLLSKLASVARVIDEDKGQRQIQATDLEQGMTVLVAAGENIPADGVIISGTSEVDRSLITGETMPEAIGKGDHVFAGTQNISGSFIMEVSCKNTNSLLAEIIELMEKLEQGQAHFVRIADRAAQLYTPIVHLLALLTFVGWFGLMGSAWQEALLVSVTVLIITCPCALGLAVPVVQMLTSGRLMASGVLLKSADALEGLSTIDTVVFDKTGTLTEGDLRLKDGHRSLADEQLAASMARHSRHPLSKAICADYSGPFLDLEVKEIPGQGLEACINGQLVRLGRFSFVSEITDKPIESVRNDSAAGPAFWLGRAGEIAVHFAFADNLRADAAKVIEQLNRAGVGTVILSGDSEQAVASVAKALHVDHYKAQATPLDKTAYIEALSDEGRKILYVGDGLNDAPALTSAHVSMSPAEAVDIAQNAADIIFQGKNLSPVAAVLTMGRKSQRLVLQNFGLAVLYNVIAVPFAVMGFVTPLVAAAAMSGSSLIVVANAFRINLGRQKG